MPSNSRGNPAYVRGNYKPLGNAQYVGAVASTALTATPTSGVVLPTTGAGFGAQALIAVIQVDTQSIRYTDDGVLVPSATLGILIPTNAIFVYDGDLYAFRFIQTLATATINVAYYG